MGQSGWIHRNCTPEEAPALSKVAPSTPASVCAVVLKALRKNPDDRYPDARAMAEALAAATQCAPQASPTRRMGDWRQDAAGHDDE